MLLNKTKPILIITGPSGTGKTTLANMLVERLPFLQKVITTTTRSPRANEINGKDYYFISQKQFEDNIAHEQMVEWARFSNSFYGTEKQELEKIWSANKIPLVAAEIAGARFWHERGGRVVFLAPSDIEQLHRQLVGRGDMNPIEIDKRLAIANEQLKTAHTFSDYVINEYGKVGETLAEITKIAEQLRESLPQK